MKTLSLAILGVLLSSTSFAQDQPVKNSNSTKQKVMSLQEYFDSSPEKEIITTLKEGAQNKAMAALPNGQCSPALEGDIEALAGMGQIFDQRIDFMWNQGSTLKVEQAEVLVQFMHKIRSQFTLVCRKVLKKYKADFTCVSKKHKAKYQPLAIRAHCHKYADSTEFDPKAIDI